MITMAGGRSAKRQVCLHPRSRPASRSTDSLVAREQSVPTARVPAPRLAQDPLRRNFNAVVDPEGDAVSLERVDFSPTTSQFPDAFLRVRRAW